MIKISYIYEAINNEGKKIKGYSMLDNRRELANELREKNYYLILYKRKKEVSYFMKKVGSKDLYIFSNQMSYMLNAGFNICECLNIMYSKFNGILRKNIGIIKINIQSGKTLYESICCCKDSFPYFFKQMVLVGEEGGNLDVIFKNIAVYYKKIYKTKDEIKNMIVYPIVVFILTIVLTIFLIVDIIPKFSEILNGLGGKLPGSTQTIMNISTFIRQHLISFILSLSIVITILNLLCKSKFMKKKLDKAQFKIPFISNIYKKEISRRFIFSLSILIKSGISIIEAMDIASQTVQNAYAENSINKCIINIRNGKGIGESFENTDVFSRFTVDMYYMAEECGNIDEVLINIAEIYEEEINNEVKRAVSLFEPFTIVILSIFIGSIIISVMMPVINIMNSI
ncbi:type II secretion system F family protein [Clostridium guangxiense]|uniref:type II secretion system F family protein n=1 Tax=Clostridium guangxiense TaxID=1662055 RepID=UPI001E5EDB58|nr:type II secretion system F family protein [Clostridium guangxiense]